MVLRTTYEGRVFEYIETGNRARLLEGGESIWWGVPTEIPVDLIPRSVLLDLSIKRNAARCL